MKKHFVMFLSPGTFFHEYTELPIDSWDVKKACKMAHNINERNGARPFAFQFSTRTRNADELDSKVSKASGRYFLGGKLMSKKDIQRLELKENKPKRYEILLSNMRNNGWSKVVMNDNSYRIFQPFEKDDVLLNFKLKPRTKRKAE